MNLQIKRLKVLQQIDRQISLLCENCQAMAKSAKDVNCTCDASNKLRNLGDRLMQLVSPRKDETAKGMELLRSIGSIENLTIHLLFELRELKITDKKIYEELKVSATAFNLWKKERGVLKSYKKSEE